MKIVQVNCGENGSIGQIMRDIDDALQQRGDSSEIFYGLGMKSKEKNHHKITERYENGINKRVSYFTGIRFGFAPLATAKLIHYLKVMNPDVVHLHCPNGYMVNLYELIRYITSKRIPLVITNHCEMFYTGNCDHSYECEKWMTGCGNCKDLLQYVGSFRVDRTSDAWRSLYESFRNTDKVAITSVSKWVYERSSISPITARFPNYIVENGVDAPKELIVQGVLNENMIRFVSGKYSIDRKKKNILFVTAHFSSLESDNKGGYYFLKLAEKLSNDDSIRLILVGSMGNEDYLPKNVINIGRINNKKELFALYALSDIALVLSKRETFSMVCAESLSVGTPVVGFLAKGPESISLEKYSRFCEHGDINGLKRCIYELFDVKQKNRGTIIKEARRRYSTETMKKKYLSIYDELTRTSISNSCR